jgi:hypothetical protein
MLISTRNVTYIFKAWHKLSTHPFSLALKGFQLLSAHFCPCNLLTEIVLEAKLA